jgi:RNA polymerase sigma-70 factor, ECF subfamily
MLEEKEIIALLKNDDQEALKQLFDTWHSTLCLIAFRIIKDRDQAKDVVQNVFIKLWRNRKQLQITSSLSGYLKRATVNTALNYIESPAYINKQEIEKADLSFYATNSTDHGISYDELKVKSDAAIQSLPVRTRAVFALIRSEEMSYKEVSATLGISTKAVEKEMMKALKILREALKEYLLAAILFFLAYSFNFLQY